MALPDNVPSNYSGDSTDFKKTKRDTFGANRIQYNTIAVADSASAGTTYGIFPFNKGFRFDYGSTIHVSDLDTGTTVTLNVGYEYEDTAVAVADPDAFASAVTTAQGGGFITFDEVTGLSWVAEDDGWVIVSIAAGPVTTAGTLQGQVKGVYDGTEAQN